MCVGCSLVTVKLSCQGASSVQAMSSILSCSAWMLLMAGRSLLEAAAEPCRATASSCGGRAAARRVGLGLLHAMHESPVRRVHGRRCEPLVHLVADAL